MAVTPAYMKASFKNLSGLEDETYVTAKIAWAAARISADILGALYDQAHAFLTAHLIEVDNRGGQGGLITSERVGDLSRSYENAFAEDAMGSTSYGVEFLNICRIIPTSPLVG